MADCCANPPYIDYALSANAQTASRFHMADCFANPPYVGYALGAHAQTASRCHMADCFANPPYVNCCPPHTACDFRSEVILFYNWYYLEEY
jgi:hypothetical protein